VVKIGEEVHGNVKAKDLERLLRQASDQPAAGRHRAAAAAAAAAERLRPRVRSASRKQARMAGYKGMLMVCTGTGCVAAKGFASATG
jgi:septal ring factor EnvC (AmiA/AmiB activator)